MLEIQNVTFAYNAGPRVLDGISLELPREHVVAILGESGSGKTTLLNCIGRFLRPQSGHILIDGVDIDDIDEVAFRRLVGTVFQGLDLFPHLSVIENLMLAPVHVLKQPPSRTRGESVAMLEQLSILELSESYPAQISGGQAQRVALARSLMMKPEYLLLDEPTSALDVQTTREFAAWLLELKTETTFVLVTHDIPFAEAAASHAVVVENGAIKEQGRIQDIAIAKQSERSTTRTQLGEHSPPYEHPHLRTASFSAGIAGGTTLREVMPQLMR